MEQITRQVKRARRRLLLQQFVNCTALWLFGMMMVAAVAILIPKVWAMDLDQNQWMSAWLLGAILVAVVGGAITTWLTRTKEMDAAIELDRRFGLKERLSSTLAMSDPETSTSAGQALVDDAVRKAERIDVSDQFRFQGRWVNFLPLIPAILVFVLAVFVPDATKQDAQAAATSITAKQQVKKSTDQLKKKLAERKRLAEEEGLEAAREVFSELEKGVSDLSKLDADPKKAMVKLNNLSDQLEKRRKSLGDAEKLKQKLNQLKNLKAGPGDRMAKAMKKGNFNTAMKELKQLKEKLAKGKMSEKEQKQLAAQLKQMSKMMQQMADNQEQAKESLKQEIQNQRESGNLAKAAELQKKLDKLAAQDAQMKKLAKMAQKMAQASENISQKQLAKAAQAMSEMSEEMSDMKAAMEQMEMLDEAMEQLASAKNSMTCENCNGEGCAMCQGGMQSMMASMSRGRGQGRGMGMGDGQGIGDRPEAKTNKNLYDSRVRSNARNGRAVVTGLVDGPNVSGEAMEEIKSAIEAADYATDDPLSGNRLPKDVRDHVRDYFQKRGGTEQE